jgi:hypothetical protein
MRTALAEPSRERRRQGRITRAAEQVADAQGGIGQPWIAETMLARLYRRGSISQIQMLAGEQFQRLVRDAHHDMLRAADLSRDVRHASPVDAIAVERARDSVWVAIRALGGMTSPCGSCAWFVLGNFRK